jgi:hypothetical protein
MGIPPDPVRGDAHHSGATPTKLKTLRDDQAAVSCVTVSCGVVPALAVGSRIM